jgi:predicted ATPase
MPYVVITGGPGAGKTTLLAQLAAMGYPTVAESARAIIAERLAGGKSPRPAPLAFAREILRRDTENYLQHAQGHQWVFFDRSVVESIAMVHAASPIAHEALQNLLAQYRFHPLVFVLPPWEAIYVTDAERDHSFDHAVQVHDDLVSWYRSSGYQVHPVPRVAAVQRAQHVLRVLFEAGA